MGDPGCRVSGQDATNHVAVDVRQPDVASAETEGEPGVVQAEQVQDRGMEIVHADFVLDAVQPEFVVTVLLPGQSICGAILSTTSIVAVQVAVFMAASVTVRVTTCVPGRLTQEKAVWESDRVTPEQLSLEPLSTMAVVRVA